MLKRTKLVDGEAMLSIDEDEYFGLTFDAPYRKDVAFQFYAPLRDRASMSNVSCNVLSQLQQNLDDVALHNYLDGEWVDSALLDYHYINRSAPVAYFLGVPNEVPDFIYDHPFSIGGFVCETDRIDPEWVRVCNRLDLVTVPSTWCREAFFRSGVKTPILVVSHGIEPEYQSYKTRQRSVPFVFYNTFHASSFASRKSLEELISCFLCAFEGRSDVVLRLRTNLSIDLMDCRNRYDFGDLIQLDLMTEHLDTEQFARLYSDVHCTVHPSKGEGFGLVPFQSIACETPVIAPHRTGMTDYLTDSNSISLKTSGRVAGEGVGNGFGTYFSIDEDDLVDRLLYVEKNWESEYEKVCKVAPEFRQKHAWPSVLAEFMALIQELAGTEDLPAMKRAVQERYGPANKT